MAEDLQVWEQNVSKLNLLCKMVFLFEKLVIKCSGAESTTFLSEMLWRGSI